MFLVAVVVVVVVDIVVVAVVVVSWHWRTSVIKNNLNPALALGGWLGFALLPAIVSSPTRLFLQWFWSPIF